MTQLEKRYAEVKAAIIAAAESVGRDPGEVSLVAVTKTVGINQIREALALGISDFGENRVQSAAPKVAALSQARWHFIGHLQSNKVSDVLPHYSLIHSLDRPSLAAALQNAAESRNATVDALVQVNVSGEKSKFGLEPSALPDFLEYLSSLERIRVCGLMTMAPFVDDPEEVRPVFRRLRELRNLYATSGNQLKELSMGMTNDYPIAVEEGATIVRIGSALFS
jgi:pyridoxal phosphate enzyme (YggS family)